MFVFVQLEVGTEEILWEEEKSRRYSFLRYIVPEGSLRDLLFWGNSLGDLMAGGRVARVTGQGGNGGRPKQTARCPVPLWVAV